MAARFRTHHYAPHTHDEFAVGVCTGGREVIHYRGAAHVAGPGSIVVLEPGEPHTGGPAVEEGFAYRVVYPGSSLLGEGVATEPHFHDPVLHDRQLATALWRAHRVISRSRDPLEAECLLPGLLSTLARRHGRARPADERVPGAARIAGVVRERLADELREPPALADLAAELGLSRFGLLRAFRDATGMPPYAWLAQYRVARARALLDAGHRPAEVASLVGFADQAHLTRWFRRVLGVTPGAYRNSVQDSVPPAGQDCAP
jgi:AraC-like DNA-binding protein